MANVATSLEAYQAAWRKLGVGAVAVAFADSAEEAWRQISEFHANGEHEFPTEL